MPDNWNNRDLPVLRVIVELADEQPGEWVYVWDVAPQLGWDRNDVRVQQAGRRFESAGWCETTHRGPKIDGFRNPSSDALRAVEEWPTPETALDRIVGALEQLAREATDDDTRTRARKILDGLQGAGKRIGLGVATAAITGQMPS